MQSLRTARTNPAWTWNLRLKRIRQLTGTKFDPSVTAALESAIGSGKIRLNPALVAV